MRKPARAVTLEDIISNHILPEEDPDFISRVIKIHLALEALLTEVYWTTSSDRDFLRLSWPAKTAKLLEKKLITDEDKHAYDCFNDFRNDFAHIFGHRIDFSDVGKLIRQLIQNGMDFDDVFGDASDEDLSELYAMPYDVLEPVGYELLTHAAIVLDVAGGRKIFSSDEED